MTLSDLLAKHPKAVEAIRDQYGDQWLRGDISDRHNADSIRDYCIKHALGSPNLDSIETLLGLIEAQLAAEAPLTDADIASLRWRYWKGGSHCVMQGDEIIRGDTFRESAMFLSEKHNNCINRLAAEIRRLRAAKEPTP